MRFAITAADRGRSVFEALLASGWTRVKLFTNPPTPFGANAGMVARAMELKLPVQSSPMDSADLADLAARGCDALVCAGYDWRIPAWRPHLRYAVNFHPAPLPEARGPYPAFQALLGGRGRWAVTCHQIEPAFDTGAVLAEEAFDLVEDECHESLGLKAQMAQGRLARRLAQDFEKLWREAKPQVGGGYWRRLTDADREIDFTRPVDHILRQVRAFGLTETIAKVNGSTLYVRRAVGWREPHGLAPGTLAFTSGRQWVVAALDGYVGLIEWSPVSLGQREMIGR